MRIIEPMSGDDTAAAKVGTDAKSRRLEVTVERVRILSDQWAARWKRPPTNEELAGLIRGWVGDEILYREALERGLDRDDELVRRRLIQKMNGLARGLAESLQAKEGDLRAFFERHRNRYEIPARRSFNQVYVSLTDGAEEAEMRAARLLDLLPTMPSAEVASQGDPMVLPSEYSLVTIQEVASRFGPSFADTVFEIPIGGWTGPISSSFGLHLVKVIEEAPSHAPSFEEARERLLIDVGDQRKVAAESELAAALVSQYEIVYAWDDEDLEVPNVLDMPQVPDLDLLATLAVLAPRHGGKGDVQMRIPVDDSGQVDWKRLLQDIHRTGSHNEIALAGGTPRRKSLIEPRTGADAAKPGYVQVASELAKGLNLASSASVVEGTPGWLGLSCGSDDMAAWILRALAAENITVRREGTTVFVPVASGFSLENEIVDIVLAVASVFHFFDDHIRVDDHEHE